MFYYQNGWIYRTSDNERLQQIGRKLKPSAIIERMTQSVINERLERKEKRKIIVAHGIYRRAILDNLKFEKDRQLSFNF